jgi:protein subunit release factor B
MNLNELFAVSPTKVEALKKKMERLGVKLPLIEELFTRGGGKGGQKRNKTSNVVVLSYPPLQLQVRVGRERQRNVNRFLALRELVDHIERVVSPETSAVFREEKKIQKQKERRARRHRRKIQGLALD